LAYIGETCVRYSSNQTRSKNKLYFIVGYQPAQAIPREDTQNNSKKIESYNIK